MKLKTYIFEKIKIGIYIYQLLLLSSYSGKALTEVITLSNQRLAERESRKIQQQGGELFVFLKRMSFQFQVQPSI